MRDILSTLQTQVRRLLFVAAALVVAVGVVAFPQTTLPAFATCGSGCVASMQVTPGSGSYNPGNTLTVSVYVNSGGQSVNAVQADFTYSSSLLQYQSINPNGSAFAIDASSSGGGGSVSIARGNTSAVSGSSLLVAQVSFQVLSAGTGTISFSGSSAVVSSSTNQDILGSKTGGSYSITTPVTPPPPSTPSSPSAPSTPSSPMSGTGTNKKPVPATTQPTTAPTATPTTGTDTPATPTSEKTTTQTPTSQNTQQTAKKQSNIWTTVGLVAGGVVAVVAVGAGALWAIRRRNMMPVKTGTVPTSNFITGPVVHSEMPPATPLVNTPPATPPQEPRNPFDDNH